MQHFQEIFGLLPEEDAYGNNIADTFYQRGGGYDIIEREDGHFTLNGDSNAYIEPFEFWSTIQQQASAFVKGKILDIGCGGGKHSTYFQHLGLEVFAMDNSPLALEVCRMQGIQNTILCDVAHLNEQVISDLDCILMWGNNFGLLQNEKLAQRFFNVADKMLKPSGKIFIETLDPHGKAFDYEDDKVYMKNNELQGRLAGQIRVRVRYRSFCTPWADYLFVSIAELENILAQTPWKIENLIKDYKIDQYIAILSKK